MGPDSYFFSLEKKSNDEMFWEDSGEMNDKQKKADGASSSKQDSLQKWQMFTKRPGKINPGLK